MAESFSVKAMLSAQDKGFSSTFKRALGTTESLADKIKSGFAFGVLAGAGQQAFSAITNGAKEMVGEVNSSVKTWRTFEGNMKNFGKSSKEINKVKGALQKYAETTVYSSSEMAGTYAQLEAVGVGSMKSLNKGTMGLVKGFGGLAAAAENPGQAMKSLSQQATQMAAKPKVAWEDFKIMLEQSPAGMSAVAKSMGISTEQLISKIQAGKVKTEDFFAAVEKAGTSKGFQKMATEAQTMDQAMDGLKEGVANKLMPAFEVLSKYGIKAIDSISNSLGKINADELASKVQSGFKTAVQYFNVFKDAFSGVGTEVGEAITALKDSFSGMSEGMDVSALDVFKSSVEGVASAIKTFANFIEEHADTIGKALPWVLELAIAFKGFKIVSSIVPGLGLFTKTMGKLAGKGIGAIAGKLFKISGAQKEVGDASVSSGSQMLASAKSYALMGVAVLTIAAGFALLAFSAIQLANSGGLAIGVMAGLVVALVGLGVGMAVLLKTLAPMSAQLMPVATAMLLMGAAVVLVAAGFALLTFSAISLANAGPLAIAVMVGLVAVIALLAVGAAALGPALTAGAVGFIAFGAAILMVGAGALLASVALTMVSAVLPIIVAYGLQGAVAILALGASLLIFAVGATLAGVACVVLGAGLAVVAVGLALVGVAALVTTVGVIALTVAVMGLSVGALMMGASLMVASVALACVMVLLPLTAVGALLLTASFAALMAVSIVLMASLMLLNAPLALVGALSLAASAGIIAFGVAMLGGVAGTAAMAVALKAVNSSMKTISKNAKSSERSLKSMRKSVKVVESGLNSLGSKAKSAMQKIKNAFKKTESDASSSGQKVGSNFTKGLKSGLNLAPSIASLSARSVNARLRMGSIGAYSAGAYISLGFAKGMRSQLRAIRSAAEQMAIAADKAVRAKAKIHSPSRIAEKLGNYWGGGFAGGIADMAKDVWNAAKNLVAIPEVATPQLAGAFGGELSADYDYFRNAEYVIEVPLSVDGREFAKATANYTQDELNRRQIRNNRKHGKV